MESSPKNVYTIPKTKHMEQITARAMSYSAVISSQVRGREIPWSPRVVPLTPSVEVGRVSYGCPGVAGGMARGAPTELVLMVMVMTIIPSRSQPLKVIGSTTEKKKNTGKK